MKSCLGYANLLIKRNDSLLKCNIFKSYATKSKVKKDYNALDIRAKTNRENWEKEQEKCQLLKDKIPEDDVYFMKDYQEKYYSLKNAIQNFKDVCLDETIYNSPNSIVEANFVLNMRTKKKTKFTHLYMYITKLKNEIPQIPPKNVVVFSSDQELSNKLIELGAFDAGGETLVNKFLVGELNYEQFDTVICHPSMIGSMKKLKLLLRDKLPVAGEITVGEHLEDLLDKHRFGVVMKSKKVAGIPEEAFVRVPLGPINWNHENLLENLNVYLEKFKEDKKFNENTILDLILECKPSPEKFKIIYDSINEIEEEPTVSDNDSAASPDESEKLN